MSRALSTVELLCSIGLVARSQSSLPNSLYMRMASTRVFLLFTWHNFTIKDYAFERVYIIIGSWCDKIGLWSPWILPIYDGASWGCWLKVGQVAEFTSSVIIRERKCFNSLGSDEKRQGALVFVRQWTMKTAQPMNPSQHLCASAAWSFEDRQELSYFFFFFF